jgi:hypothetical protein
MEPALGVEEVGQAHQVRGVGAAAVVEDEQALRITVRWPTSEHHDLILCERRRYGALPPPPDAKRRRRRFMRQSC